MEIEQNRLKSYDVALKQERKCRRNSVQQTKYRLEAIRQSVQKYAEETGTEIQNLKEEKTALQEENRALILRYKIL